MPATRNVWVDPASKVDPITTWYFRLQKGQAAKHGRPLCFSIFHINKKKHVQILQLIAVTIKHNLYLSRFSFTAFRLKISKRQFRCTYNTQKVYRRRLRIAASVTRILRICSTHYSAVFVQAWPYHQDYLCIMGISRESRTCYLVLCKFA